MAAEGRRGSDRPARAVPHQHVPAPRPGLAACGESQYRPTLLAMFLGAEDGAKVAGPMRLETYSSAESFLRDAGSDLEAAEAENSLLLGVALRLEAEDRATAGSEPRPDAPSRPAFLATVRDRGEWLAALMTAPFPLALAGSPGC